MQPKLKSYEPSLRSLRRSVGDPPGFNLSGISPVRTPVHPTPSPPSFATPHPTPHTLTLAPTAGFAIAENEL